MRCPAAATCSRLLEVEVIDLPPPSTGRATGPQAIGQKPPEFCGEFTSRCHALSWPWVSPIGVAATTLPKAASTPPATHFRTPSAHLPR